MAPMTPGPLVVYEIPDAGGRGHRLLVADDSSLDAADAAAIVASIFGPVHVTADRLGLMRSSTQHSRGTVRDCSVIAAIAGVDIRFAPAADVLAALAILEDSIEAAMAEATMSEGGIEHATMARSKVAARVRDSIGELAFRQRELISAGGRVGAVALESRGLRHQFLESLTLLAGTFAVLSGGIAIGWMASAMKGNHVVPHVAERRPPEAPSPEAIAPATPFSARAPADNDTVREPTGRRSPEQLSAPRSAAVFRSGNPMGAIPVPLPTTRNLAAARDEQKPLAFRVTCRGTLAGDRVQLLRTIDDGGILIGQARKAPSESLAFEENATNDLQRPDQLKVRFWPAQSDRYDDYPLQRVPGTEEFACNVKLSSPASVGQKRQIRITVVAQPATDR